MDMIPYAVGLSEVPAKALLNRVNHLLSGSGGEYQEFMWDKNAQGPLTKQRQMLDDGPLDDLGMYAMPFSTFENMTNYTLDRLSIANDKPIFFETPFGVSKVKPSEELSRINNLLLLSEVLNYLPVPTRGVAQQVEKIQREQLAKYRRDKKNKMRLYKEKEY